MKGQGERSLYAQLDDVLAKRIAAYEMNNASARVFDAGPQYDCRRKTS